MEMRREGKHTKQCNWWNILTPYTFVVPLYGIPGGNPYRSGSSTVVNPKVLASISHQLSSLLLNLAFLSSILRHRKLDEYEIGS
jgi:hypothetical protein